MDQNSGQRRYDLLDRFARTSLTSYESRVLFLILKWHLVYNNGGVLISLQNISRMTGLPERHVCRSIKSLLQKQLLFKTIKNGLNFYSFTLPAQTLPIKGVLPIQGVPQEGIKYPIQGAPYINNSNQVKNTTAGSADQNIQFTESYPGSWYKSVKAKAEKIFAGMNPENQQKALKALTAYKVSKSVKDGRIFSPVNFLKDSEIIDKYSKEMPPAAPAPPVSPDQIEEWRREQAADPPRGSLSEEFKKIVADTASKKSTTKGGS